MMMSDATQAQLAWTDIETGSSNYYIVSIYYLTSQSALPSAFDYNKHLSQYLPLTLLIINIAHINVENTKQQQQMSDTVVRHRHT